MLVHYNYTPRKLPSGGGTDAVTAVGKLVLISASAPSASDGPAVYKLTLNARRHIAKLGQLFADNAKSTLVVPGKPQGKTTRLALTDPDSSALVPASASRFGGDFVLNSQDDQQLNFVAHPGTTEQLLTALKLTQSVDDTVWATRANGMILTTDASADGIVAIRGGLPSAPPIPR